MRLQNGLFFEPISFRTIFIQSKLFQPVHKVRADVLMHPGLVFVPNEQ